MKLLNGAELAGFIKERHAHQVRSLRASRIFPKLAIVQAKDDPVINTYVRLKKRYGGDIGIDVDVHSVSQADIPALLDSLNADASVNGIIVQLPLPDPAETDKLVNLVSPDKDVDSLGKHAKFDPATPMAILWLLAGYNVDLRGKNVLIVGHGKLVGIPLTALLIKSGIDISVADENTNDLDIKAREADVIITATGSPGVLKADMIKTNAVVVDAGVASEDGKTLGDLAPDVYERQDLTITPQKGGVGPLTVCALFENVIRSAERLR
ncbi:MAG TPA: bifunctional 5,10-methylenetetrahydrofolate dehydrogenase/5,10-methenyltetrahydrofolate cyclohydrolase [Candidatus Saccharimonadales bacterium]|nr:bifunctional 5,10-methylenetetrahydrofolate dehydrogenase/5,10-methenyltetrahydrofolate cyclohydrolase [Candidatus Saccharimonadales bacterium]